MVYHKEIKLLILFSLIVILGVKPSLALVVDQTTIDFSNSIVGYDNIKTIKITNPENETIKDVVLESNADLTMPKISEIGANQTVYTYFTYNPKTVGSSTISLKVYGYKLVNIPRDPKTFNIDMYDLQYTPSEIYIKEGDSINFTNKGTVNHKALCSDFSVSLDANQSQVLPFTTIKEISYFDQLTSMGGIIHVENKSSMDRVRDSSKDASITFNLNSKNAETNLTAILYVNDFNLDYYKTKESIIEIENKGNKTALNVFLQGKWITFQENKFNIEPNEKKLVKFTVKPSITTTEETNKSYSNEIFISSENSYPVTTNISVFINYGQILDNKTTDHYLGLLDQILEFCKQNPEACATYNGTSQVIFKEKDYGINLTYSEFLQVMEDLRKMAAGMERMENKHKEEMDNCLSLHTQDTAYLSQINQSLNIFYEEKKTEQRWNTFKLVALIIIILAVAIGGFIAYLGYRRNKLLSSM